jgi:putative FmdB family regulatory protein
MPLFEYACRACDHHFEALVLGRKAPACPSCGARRLDKQHSTFAAASDRSSPAEAMVGPCGTCDNPAGPGACRR